MESNGTTRSFRSRLLAWAPVVLMVAVVVWSLELFRIADDGRAWVRHTQEVMIVTSDALSRLQDAETGERGYLITGDERYLAPYVNSRDSVGALIVRLKFLTEDNPRQQRNLVALQPVVDARIAVIDTTVALRRAGNLEAAAAGIRSGEGKALMDSGRVIFAAMRAEEQRLLAQRLQREERAQSTLKIVLLLGIALTTIVSLLVNTAFGRYAARQAAISRELAQRNAELQEQAVEIELSNQQLQEQQVELEITNQQLQEQQVELEVTNQQLQEQQLELEMSAEQAQAHTEELTKTTEALRQANIAKSAFLANMSHELRTPLNAIAGHVQLVEMELHGPVTPQQRVALDRIARAQRHLLSLINDILNFSKLDAGKISYAMAVTDVGAVMKDVTAMVEPQMQGAGLTFTSSIALEPCHVWADQEKLRQILINLFNNATKFTPAGGSVSFIAESDRAVSNRMLLRVTDTGVGIPADKFEQIFDPFVQLLPATSSLQQGVGLGLAISRDLARGMGGDLTLESVVGKGSTFTLSLRCTKGD